MTAVPGDPAADLAAAPAPCDGVLALREVILASEQFRQAVAEHFDASLSETMAISCLSRAGPLSPRQLADTVGLTPSTVTALLDRLESAGMATRTPHPSDRRKTVVTITARGEESLAWVRHYMHNTLDGVDAPHRDHVARVLAGTAASLNAQALAIRSHPPIERMPSGHMSIATDRQPVDDPHRAEILGCTRRAAGTET